MTHASTFRPYHSADPVQYLSQTTAEILAPPFAQHTPREFINRFSDQQVFLQPHRANVNTSAAPVSPCEFALLKSPAVEPSRVD